MKRKILAAVVPMMIAACLQAETIGTIEFPADASTADAGNPPDGAGIGDAAALDGGACGALPVATARVTLVGNLDAWVRVPPPWDPTKPAETSNHSMTVLVYDSLGGGHAATAYFRRAGVGAWEWHAVVEGGSVQGGTAGTAVEVASGGLTFDSTGKLTAEAQTSNFNPVGAIQPQPIAFDFGDPTSSKGTGLKGLTQFASPSRTLRAFADGCAAYGGYPDGGTVSGDVGSVCASGPPMATSIIGLVGNLDSQAVVPPPWNPSKPKQTSNHSVAVTVFDSLGKGHIVEVYFRRAGAGAWEWHAMVDGGSVQGGTVGTAVEVGSGTLTFDSTGKLTAETQTSNFNPVGAVQPQAILFDFGDPTSSNGTGLKGLTQFASPSRSFRASADGCAAYGGYPDSGAQ